MPSFHPNLGRELLVFIRPFMPNRVIREGFLDSEKINSLSESSQNFFIRLMLVVDDYGRFDGRAQIIRSRCYPMADKCLTDVSNMLSDCCRVNLISEYIVDNKPYIQVLNFNQRLRQKHERYPNADNSQSIDRQLQATMPESESESEKKRKETLNASENSETLKYPIDTLSGYSIDTGKDKDTIFSVKKEEDTKKENVTTKEGDKNGTEQEKQSECVLSRTTIQRSGENADLGTPTVRGDTNARSGIIKETPFDIFWKIYPVGCRGKNGKGAAFKKWEQIFKIELNPAELFEKIISALEWQANSPGWTKENGQYIPDPSAYLNKKRWLDEPPVSMPETVKKRGWIN